MNSSTETAIIILGHLISREGKLDYQSKGRADKGIEIFRKKKRPILITTGWDYRDDSKVSLAEALKHYILENSEIPSYKVLCEKNSKDTVGDAVYSKEITMNFKELKLILVITSRYHLDRAKEIFEFVYGESIPLGFIPSSEYRKDNDYGEEQLSKEAFRKTFKGVEEGNITEIKKRLILRHPLYNSKSINQPI